MLNEDQISSDLKEAMRSKDKARLAALRAVRGEIIKLKTAGKGVELNDQTLMQAVKKLIKEHQETISMFSDAGRQEEVDFETAKLEVLQSYLPAALDDAKLAAMIGDCIKSAGAESLKDMGKVMSAMRSAVSASGMDADMKKVSELVKAQLG